MRARIQQTGASVAIQSAPEPSGPSAEATADHREMLALEERVSGPRASTSAAPPPVPRWARRWDEILHDLQMAAVMADRLVELDGRHPIDAERMIPTEERIGACVGDLVEMARIKTLDDLGEGPAAFDRTRLWLDTKKAG